MALTVATNTGALMAQAAASSVNKEMEISMERLATGKRINGAADDAAFTRELDRLVAIWRTVGERFAHVPDNLLAFEAYNEPHVNMTTRWLNRMNAAVLAVLPSRVSRIPVGPLRHFAARTSRPAARR